MKKLTVVCQTKFKSQCYGLACSLTFPDTPELREQMRPLLKQMIEQCTVDDKPVFK